MNPDPDGGDASDMTLRDWFAGQALGGWMASREGCTHPARYNDLTPQNTAVYSYRMADAMMAARATSNAQPKEKEP